MADTTIVKQNTVWISESEYEAKKLAGTLENNTVYNITKANDGIESISSLDLTSSDTNAEYLESSGIILDSKAKLTYGSSSKTFGVTQTIPLVPGDGIVIDKKSGAEQVEVKADTDYLDGKYVKTDSSTYQPAVYARKGGADNWVQDMIPVMQAPPQFESIPLRDANGRIKVNEPIDGNDVVNLAYANKHYVAIPSAPSTDSAIVMGNNGTQKLITIHGGSAVEGSIPLRSTGGVVRVGTPVGDNDATTKAYVDGLHHYTHTIAITGTNAQVYITLAIKGYPNPATALDADSTKVTVAELLAEATGGSGQPIMATGIFDVQYHVIAVYEQNKKVYIRYFDDNGCSFEDVALSDTGTVTVADIVA